MACVAGTKRRGRATRGGCRHAPACCVRIPAGHPSAASRCDHVHDGGRTLQRGTVGELRRALSGAPVSTRGRSALATCQQRVGLRMRGPGALGTCLLRLLLLGCSVVGLTDAAAQERAGWSPPVVSSRLEDLAVGYQPGGTLGFRLTD